jgi:peptidylprolyl isomerase
MKNKTFVILFASLLTLILSSRFSIFAQNSQTLIRIDTDFGEIKVKLYDETPKHKENFLKLVEEGFYDELLFHRVIKEFMVQGGDPDSKGAKEGAALGEGGPGYTIPAEFVEGLIHKKGVLAAARQGDNVNPKKESSGSQFYIVQGKIFTKEELSMYQERMNQGNRNKIFNEIITLPENADHLAKLKDYSRDNNQEGVESIVEMFSEQIEEEMKKRNLLFTFTEEQIEAYTTVGGAPHLDGAYTVFGEVVEGIEVVDKIAEVQVDRRSRPVKDVTMKMKILN